MNTNVHKHLVLHLDSRLYFNYHIKEKIAKVNKLNKGIGLLKKLRFVFPRKSLATLYKSFIRPHLDYGDIIYDQPLNEAFCHQLESLQYNAALAITGAIRETSQEKLYAELGFKSLKNQCWFRRLCAFYKIYLSKNPDYLFRIIPKRISHYNTQSNHVIEGLWCRTVFKTYSFLKP